MKHTTVFAAIGLALAVALPYTPAQAQLQHTFVSSKGSDSNNCTLATPCRHLQTALAATLPGGEIAILDSAGYNNATTVIINKAISIVAPLGIEAEIALPADGNGFEINVGPNDAVSLRGLTIDGAGAGLNGILFTSGGSLTIDNCVIRHVANDGLEFLPNSASRLFVSRSVISDNNGSGIIIQPFNTSSSVSAEIDRVTTNGNGIDGIFVGGHTSTGSVQASVSNSVSAGNGADGYDPYSQPGQATAIMTVFHSVASTNAYGLASNGSGATLRVAQSVVSGNGVGWTTDGVGLLVSYGDNYIDDNLSGNTAPTTTARK